MKIKVYTWNDIEHGEVTVEDGALVCEGFSAGAVEGIEDLLTPETLDTCKDIIVVWLPGAETGVAYNPIGGK